MFFWFIFAFALAMALSEDAHLDIKCVGKIGGAEPVLNFQVPYHFDKGLSCSSFLVHFYGTNASGGELLKSCEPQVKSEVAESGPSWKLYTIKPVYLEDEGLYYCFLYNCTHANTLETFKLAVSCCRQLLELGTKARLEYTTTGSDSDSGQAQTDKHSQTQTSAPTLPGGNYTSVSSHTPIVRESVRVAPEAATSVNPTPKSFRDSCPNYLWLKVGGVVTLCLLVIVCFVAVTRCIRRRKKKQKVLISQNGARVLCASPTELVPEKQSCRYEDHPSVRAARAESAVYFTISVSGEDTALSPGDRSKATTACDADPTYCNVSRRRENFLPKWKLLPFPDPADSRQ